MRRTLGFLLFCFMLQPGTAQQLQLENTASDRTITLETGSFVELNLDMPSSNMITCNTRILEGELRTPDKGLLQIFPIREHKTYHFENGLHKQDETNYEGLIGRKPLRLALEDVNHVRYQSRTGKRVNAIGKVLLSAGLASALLVAPLASIDYGTGTFNGDRYFQIAGYSFAASGAGMAIMLGTRKRDFAIAQTGDLPDKKRWTLRILN